MPWYDEVPIVLPPMIVLRGDLDSNRYIAFVHDEANDEITHIAFKNRTPNPWTVRYSWKNQTDQEFTIDPMTPHTEIGIPPGQRRFVPLTGDKRGWDSELDWMEA